MREIQRTIRCWPPSDASAIITGKSGTGKEVVARAVHALSARRNRPFIAINAAAIPEGSIESEIFGHEPGAFTGATRARPGVFELANGGTLFLDEIAEMPISLPTRCSGFSRDGRARRLGGSKEVQFDVRVIAATNRSPAQAVSRWHAPRGFVLSAERVRVSLPALNERSEDIGLLAQHFVGEFGRKHQMNVEGVWRRGGRVARSRIRGRETSRVAQCDRARP
mgnify:CR=1 FL=1